jgi:hypothetical protein
MKIKNKSHLLFLILAFSINLSALSQTDTIKSISANGGVDLVSRYLWRGQDYSKSPSIQPTLSATWKGVTLGSWGSYNFTGSGLQETDLFLTKSIGPVTFALWDYWTYCDTLVNNVFDYKKKTTAHQLEVQALISGGEILPFNLMGSYFFYGADSTKSIYIELQYLHSFGKMDLQLFAGFQPKGEFYGNKATFVNVGCVLIKPIKITESWELPLSLSFIVNPYTKSAYLVAGITF